MKNKIYFKIIFLFFIILFLSLFYFYSPNFFSGFVVKNNFSNYSFLEYNVSFYNSTTIILPDNIVVKSIVLEGDFLSDKKVYFFLEYNNTSINFFNNNTNNIVGFINKIFNFSENITLKNNITNTNLSLKNNSLNLSNNSNNTNDSNLTKNIINFTTNITNNKTINNTTNLTNINLENKINITNNTTLTNNSINLTINLTNNTLNFTNNLTLNNTNTTTNITNNANNLTNTTILEYGNGFFDYNNDGIVSKQDAVDFKIKNNFTNESCTFWSVISEKNSFFVCSGNNDCCSSYGLNSSYNDPSYFVLYYDNIKSNTGRVLAKLDNLSFSNPLLFNFSGKKETITTINSCNNFCNLNITNNILTFKTNALFKGKIKIYYETKNNKETVLDKFNRKMIKYKGKIVDERIIQYITNNNININTKNNANILNLQNTQKNINLQKVIIKLKNNTIKEDYITNINNYINNNNVEIIEVDDPISLFTYDTINITNFNKIILPKNNFSGSNVSICILDTGFNTSILNNTLFFSYNSVFNSSSVFDFLNHGSKVLFPFSVLVPNATFYLVKVFDDNNESFESYVLKGLDYCLEKKVDVVSLSIGTGGYNGFCDDNILAQKVNELTRNNITVIAAAGNSGDEFIAVPACASNATSVVSVNKGGALTQTTSFNQNFTLITAPGESILTKDNNLNYVYASGTSISVPFVSSLAVFLKEKNKTLTPIEIRKIILNTGKIYNYTDIYSNKTYIYTMINAYNALNNYTTNNFTYNSSQGIGNYSKKISPFTTTTITISGNDVVEMKYTTSSNWYSARYSDSDYVYTDTIPTYDLNKGTYISQPKKDYYSIPLNSIPSNAYINSVTVTAISAAEYSLCGLGDKKWGSYSRIQLKSGLSERLGSSIYPGNTKTTFSYTWTSNPFTYKQWKSSDINNLKPGIYNSITSSDLSCTSDKVSRVTTDRVYMTVDYVYDGCTPPTGRDWYVPLEDNCQVTSNVDIYPYKLILYGSSGSFTIKSGGSLTVKGIDFTPDDFNGDASFNIETGGNLIVKP